MTPDDRWLAAVWPFVQEQLPPPPAAVLEIGCGALGGFVPALRDAGHRVVGGAVAVRTGGAGGDAWSGSVDGGTALDCVAGSRTPS